MARVATRQKGDSCWQVMRLLYTEFLNSAVPNPNVLKHENGKYEYCN